MANHRLTPAQQEFCRRLVAGDTQADAYIAAFPKAGAWQKSNVRTQASKLARRPHIRTTVAAMQRELTDRVTLENVRLLKEIARIAFADPRGVVDQTGRVKMLNELDEATAAAVASFEITEKGGIKYRFHDKNSSLERACKILAPMATSNSPTYGQSNSSMQDERIMRHRR